MAGRPGAAPRLPLPDDSIPPRMRPLLRVVDGWAFEAAPATSARTVERPPGVADSLRQALAGPPAGQFCLLPGHSLLPWGARAFSCLDRGNARACALGVRFKRPAGAAPGSSSLGPA